MGTPSTKIQQVENMGIWMVMEWTISSGYFDFEVPTEWRTKHAKWASKHTGIELRSEVASADINDFIKEFFKNLFRTMVQSE